MYFEKNGVTVEVSTRADGNLTQYRSQVLYKGRVVVPDATSRLGKPFSYDLTTELLKLVGRTGRYMANPPYSRDFAPSDALRVDDTVYQICHGVIVDEVR